MTYPPSQKVYWSKRERDIVYHRDGTVGDLTASKATSMVIAHAFEGTKVLYGKSLREVLEERGYDMTTIRFSIRKKKPEPDQHG